MDTLFQDSGELLGLACVPIGNTIANGFASAIITEVDRESATYVPALT